MACTSVSIINRPTSFWPPCTRPNSPDCLIALSVSCPALANATTSAFELCACSAKEEKSAVLVGCGALPAPLPPHLRKKVRGALLGLRAKGIVGGDEVPGFAPPLDHGRGRDLR